MSWDFTRCTRQGRGASLPFVSGDGFRCIADHVFDETTNNELQPPLLAPARRTIIVFIKGDLAAHWFQHWHGKIAPHVKEFGYLGIVHNSDETIGASTVGRALEDGRLRYLFAQNLDPAWVIDRLPVRPVPIGLENLRWGRQQPHLYQNCASQAPWRERLQSLLLSFNPNNDDRHAAVRALADSSFVHLSLKPHPTRPFIENLARSKFVLSPRGNGLDCHRTWEAMACGCVPVLKRGSLHTDTFDVHDSVVWVDDWTKVEPQLLAARVEKGVVASTGHLMQPYLARISELIAHNSRLKKE